MTEYCPECDTEMEEFEGVEDSWNYASDMHTTTTSIFYKCPKCGYEIEPGMYENDDDDDDYEGDEE
jgi:rubredoxin